MVQEAGRLLPASRCSRFLCKQVRMGEEQVERGCRRSSVYIVEIEE